MRIDQLIKELQAIEENYGSHIQVKMTATVLPEGYYKDKELEKQMQGSPFDQSDVWESTLSTLLIRQDENKVPYVKADWRC